MLRRLVGHERDATQSPRQTAETVIGSVATYSNELLRVLDRAMTFVQVSFIVQSSVCFPQVVL